jgi:hypothetical protein
MTKTVTRYRPYYSDQTKVKGFDATMRENSEGDYVRWEDYAATDRLLGDMLAVIHGDGGHYQAKHGVAKAVADAIAKYYATRFDALCPHGMPLAENICGPCSQGRPNRRAAEPPAEPMPFKDWAADIRTQSMQNTIHAYKAKIQKLEYDLACRPESSPNRGG